MYIKKKIYILKIVKPEEASTVHYTFEILQVLRNDSRALTQLPFCGVCQETVSNRFGPASLDIGFYFYFLFSISHCTATYTSALVSEF